MVGWFAGRGVLVEKSTRDGRARRKSAYVLVTAAYNERASIEKTLRSVVSQSLLPRHWVIVSDGSTDGTDEVVQEYARRHSFISLDRICEEHPRNFGAQAVAINRGFDTLQLTEYDYIGNLDADVSLPPDYFQRLLAKFALCNKLGLAGGTIYEDSGEGFEARPTNSIRSVPLALQVFRKECFEAVGRYPSLPFGGSDWYAEVKARMGGWRVESFPDLPAYHHRRTGGAVGAIRYCFLQGKMDFALGVDPVFEVLKVASRAGVRPYGLGTIARFGGFVLAICTRQERLVSEAFIEFLRKEQRARIRQYCRRCSVDSEVE